MQWVGLKIRKRLKIVYNGSHIYKLSKRFSLKNRLPRLISVGRLVHEKNFLVAIAAISEIRDNIESYTIIGVGKYKKKLERLIVSLKLENKIKLAGWKENVEESLQKADIQIIPSLYEGFGLVAVEGMSKGLLVVASNIDGLKEVLGSPRPSLILVDKVDSIQEWKKGISQAIYNIKNFGINKIAKLSARKAKKFTFLKMSENYLNAYSNKLIK